jgi:hypothetical protein
MFSQMRGTHKHSSNVPHIIAWYLTFRVVYHQQKENTLGCLLLQNTDWINLNDLSTYLIKHQPRTYMREGDFSFIFL